MLVLIYDDSFKKEEESNKDEISFDPNFFTRLFEKFSERIRNSLKDSFAMIKEQYQTKFEARLKAFLDKCVQVKNEVKNDYDAVKLGLKLEEEILRLFK